ncbi:hypothetical protein [Kribbella sp. NPDC023855]|uniref:hypothetical protein n=1 Tax=Kribbella sp. NPDC023855 TaxID=3154698 RepID=UPI0033D48923
MSTADQVLGALFVAAMVCILGLCWSLQQAHYRLDALEHDLDQLLDEWTDEDQADQADDDQGDPDTCRPLEVDGQTIRVLGSGEWTDEDRAAMTEVVRATQQRMGAEQA